MEKFPSEKWLLIEDNLSIHQSRDVKTVLLAWPRRLGCSVSHLETIVGYIDIKTQRWADEVENGWDNLPEFGLANACIYRSDTKQYHHYTENQVAGFIKSLTECDLIVGFNPFTFGYGVLSKYTTDNLSDVIPTFDILYEIADILGYRVSLDALSEGTLGFSQRYDGREVTELYKQDQMEKVREVCESHVYAVKKIFKHGCTFGAVGYFDKQSTQDARINCDYWRDMARFKSGISVKRPNKVSKTEIKIRTWLESHNEILSNRLGFTASHVIEGYEILCEKKVDDWTSQDWLDMQKAACKIDGQDPLYIAIVGAPELTLDELYPDAMF